MKTFAALATPVGSLPDTGSNVFPWLIVAGIIVLLGVIALVVGMIVRSRRTPPAGPAAADDGEQISPDSPQ